MVHNINLLCVNLYLAYIDLLQTSSQEFHLYCSAAYTVIVKTLDHKNEYMFQSWAYVNIWYLFTSLQRVWLRFSEELYQKQKYWDF